MIRDGTLAALVSGDLQRRLEAEWKAKEDAKHAPRKVKASLKRLSHMRGSVSATGATTSGAPLLISQILTAINPLIVQWLSAGLVSGNPTHYEVLKMCSFFQFMC